jgi:four helix bundle protein
MQLDHERLDVYHLSLDFMVFANQLVEGLPRGRSHLSDQFLRSSSSVVLNIAEGAGRHSPPDKRRFYLIARGSAAESAAMLDVFSRLELVGERELENGKGMLVRVVSMLVKLAQGLKG